MIKRKYELSYRELFNVKICHRHISYIMYVRKHKHKSMIVLNLCITQIVYYEKQLIT